MPQGFRKKSSEEIDRTISRQIERRRPREWTEEGRRLTPLAHYPDESRAQMAAEILRSHDIYAFVQADAAGGVYGGISFDFGSGYVLAVPRGQASQAELVLCASGIRCTLPGEEEIEAFCQRHLPEEGAEMATGRVLEALSERSKEFLRRFVERLLSEGDRAFLFEALRSAVREEEHPILYEAPPLLLAAGSTVAEAFCDLLADELGSPEPEIRIRALRTLGAAADGRDVAWLRSRFGGIDRALRRIGRHLVAGLEDSEEPVRDEALEALYFLAGGRSFDFDPAADAADRESAVQAWRNWLQSTLGEWE